MYTHTRGGGISYSEHDKNGYTQDRNVLAVASVHTEGWGTSYSECHKVVYTQDKYVVVELWNLRRCVYV